LPSDEVTEKPSVLQERMRRVRRACRRPTPGRLWLQAFAVRRSDGFSALRLLPLDRFLARSIEPQSAGTTRVRHAVLVCSRLPAIARRPSPLRSSRRKPRVRGGGVTDGDRRMDGT
jgi:hypothetical protein